MLTLNNICLNYSYKKVLSGVNATFENGKIYSLLGENGAGKSTLAHIICGDLQQTSGSLILNGEEVHFSSPHQALLKKIACVHQRPLLADSISVYENLQLGAKKVTKAQIEQVLKTLLPRIKKNTLVKNLNPAEKFFVSLAGILLKNPEIIILDEPTALLKPEETEFLFKNLKALAEGGKTIIVITHHLEEAAAKTDEIIILRDGIVADSGRAADFTEEKIQAAIFGTSAENTDKKDMKNTEGTDPEISDSIKKLFINSDEDTLTGMKDDSIRQLRKERTAIIPSDRTFRASNPELTILQLVTSYKTKLTKKELYEYAEYITKKAEVNIRLEEKASNLSGGMLQRLILQRELDTNPEKIIFCSPYQGLDSQAVKKLNEIISQQIKAGKKVILAGEKS